MRQQLGSISRIKDSLSFRARLQLVSSLALSKMNYMICQWGSTTENAIRKAQVVQNQAARLMNGMHRSTSKRTLMRTCGWLDIRELVEYHGLTQMWKIAKWNMSGYFKDKITTIDDGKLSTQAPGLQLTAGGFRRKKWWTNGAPYPKNLPLRPALVDSKED